MSFIEIVEAEEHNLKLVNSSIPIKKMTTITGPSGSGKTSLLFNTLWDFHRHKVSIALKDYAQIFPRPKVKKIFGLPNVIAVKNDGIAQLKQNVGEVLSLKALILKILKSENNFTCQICNSNLLYHSQEFVDKAINRYSSELLIFSSPITFNSLEMKIWLEHGFRKFIQHEKITDYDSETILDNIAIQVIVDICKGSDTSATSAAIQTIIKQGKPGLNIYTYSPQTNKMSRVGEFYLAPYCIHCLEYHLDLQDFNNNELRCSACTPSTQLACKECFGIGVNRKILGLELFGRSLPKFFSTPFGDLLDSLPNSSNNHKNTIINIIKNSVELGLSHITPGRSYRSLSYGEQNRVRLSKVISYPSTGTAVVLDEPTLGLHQKDVIRVIKKLREFVDHGNTVICVEHDPQIIDASDYLIEMGPGRGEAGGEIIKAGTRLIDHNHFVPPLYKKVAFKNLFKFSKINFNNLKNLSVSIPIGGITSVSGVSGSGKSSLVMGAISNLLLSSMSNDSANTSTLIGELETITRFKIGAVHQLGRKGAPTSNRSTVASFLGIHRELADIFSLSPLARIEGISSKDLLRIYAHPKNNAGELVKKIIFKGVSFSAALEMTLLQLSRHYSNNRKIALATEVASKLVIDYIPLSRTIRSLSFGELQRLRLCKIFLSKIKNGIFLLDEPTSGLDDAAIHSLVTLMRQKTPDSTFIVVEHNRFFIDQSDWNIELGPGAGEYGGRVI